MRKAVILLLVLIAAFFFVTKSQAGFFDLIQLGNGNGTINQLNQWVTSGGNVRLGSSTATLRVPSLQNCDTIDTNGSGVLSCGTDSGGSGNQFPTSTDPLIATYFVATGTATSTFPNLSVITGLSLFGTYGQALSDFCVAITGGSGLCDGNDASGVGGTGLATTSPVSSSNVLVYSSVGAGSAYGAATGTLTTNATGLEFNATRHLVGGAAILGLTSGYNIPLTASTSNWNSFYDTPSTRITAGTGIDWTGNTLNGVYTAGDGITLNTEDFDCDTADTNTFGCLTDTDWDTFNNKQASLGSGTAGQILAWLSGVPTWTASTTFSGGLTYLNGNVTNTLTAGDALTRTGDDIDFDGGATPSGDLGGTWASPSVTDDSHAHTGGTLSGIDISGDTNLTAGDGLTLTDDDLDCDIASGTIFGCLSSANWMTFNNKLSNIVEDLTPELGGELDANAQNIIDLGDITFKTGAAGGTIRTGTSAADKFVLEAYDVNDGVYRNIFEIDAGNVVTYEFNEEGEDLDFRVESDIHPHAFFMDGTAGNVGISTSSPYARLSVVGEVVASHVTATSTLATSSFTSLLASRDVRFSALTSCDTIDTDSNGFLKCGTDASGGGAAYDWVQELNGETVLTPSSTVSVLSKANIYASSTINAGDNINLLTNNKFLTAVDDSNTIFNVTGINASNVGVLFPGAIDVHIGDVSGPTSYIKVNSIASGDKNIHIVPGSGGLDIDTTLGGAEVVMGATPWAFLGTGNVGIATSTPYAKLSVVGQIVGAFFTGTTTATSTFGGSIAVTEANATSTFAGGIDLSDGCFALDGVCLGGGITGSGADTRMTFWNGVSTVTSDSRLTYNDTTNLLSVDFLSVNDGAAATPGLYLASDSDTGFWSAGNNEIAISTAGIERFRFSNANFGIGTTSPYARLSVVGETVSTNFTATSTTAFSTFNLGTFLTALRIPFGTAPTVDDDGECAIDSTSGQFKCDLGTSVKVVGNGNFYPTFTYSTTTAWAGTTTIPLGTAYIGETWNGVQCFTDTGILGVQFSDGTNLMNPLAASTTVGTVTLSTNNTFTAAEKRYVAVGTPVSAPRSISCTVNKSYTAD